MKKALNKSTEKVRKIYQLNNGLCFHSKTYIIVHFSIA